MKNVICILIFFLTGLFLINAQEKVIFDSDFSSDWDDLGDLAVLHALADLDEVEIIACIASSTDAGAAPGMHLVNSYFGRPDIPCGTINQSAGAGGFSATLIAKFPGLLSKYKTGADCPLALDLYRQVLAAQPDNSVTIVTAGYLHNLEELLKSGADQYSDLTGMELIKKKVKLFACAGGAYPNGSEFNFANFPDVTDYVLQNWPYEEVPARFVGFDIGQCILTGSGLNLTPATNPVRYIYVDTKTNGYPHPSWSQIMIYSAVRQEESQELWGYRTTGYNIMLTDGVANYPSPIISEQGWDYRTTTPWLARGTNIWNQDGQDHNQKYFIERQRYPIQESLESLMMNSGWPKSAGTVAPPNMPSNLRAEVSGNTIALKWADNSWNETGFVIERKIGNNDFAELATVGEDVTTYTDGTVSQTTGVLYRVKARNDIGDSGSSLVALYDWEEKDFSTNPKPPYQGGLYYYYDNHLRWNQGGDYRPNHVVLNHDSEHERNVRINVHVGALGHGGTFYVYFFYQDTNNWYRLSVADSEAKFEKKVGGTVQQIASGNINSETIGSGSQLQPWIIEVSENGTMKYYNYALLSSRVQAARQEILTVTGEDYAFAGGKIGLGGDSRTPVWQNFYFEFDPSLTNLKSAVLPADIMVYPNPAKDVIYLTGVVPEATLYSLQGQCLLSLNNVNSINVGSLSSGMYILRLKDTNGNQKSIKVEIR